MAKATTQRPVETLRSSRENRRSPRTPLMVRVDYTAVDKFFSDFTTDINEGGMFIETSSPPAPGTKVTLAFSLPNNQEPLLIEGRVVWSNPDGEARSGMGIEFEELSSTARHHINELVRGLRTSRRFDVVS